MEAKGGTLQVGISDHDLIFVVRKKKIPKPKARIIQFKNAFLTDLRNVPRDSSYTYDNIDDIWSHWSGLYTKIPEEHAPMKRTKFRYKQLPWISPDIQMQTRKRNRRYEKFRRTLTDLNWSIYREQRNRVTALKKRAVKDFCIDAASSESSGLFWKKMKPFLPNNSLNGDNF